MARVVHFTHHLCVLADPLNDTYRDRYRATPNDQLTAYERCFGSRSRIPEGRGVLHCAIAGRTSLFTTDATKVTCRRCREGCEQGKERAWLEQHHSYEWQGIRDEASRPTYTWEDDATLTVRAWYLCCRHGGHAAPAGVDGDRVVREWDAIDRARRLGQRFRNSRFSFGTAAEQRAELAAAVDAMDDDTRELVRPAIGELNMALEILEEVDRMRDNAERMIAAVCESILADAKREPIARAA